MCLFIKQQKVAYKYKQEEESQKMFVLNYVYVGCLILTFMLWGIFKCGDI